jgi:hypothetical protein
MTTNELRKQIKLYTFVTKELACQLLKENMSEPGQTRRDPRKSFEMFEIDMNDTQ